MNAIGHNEFAPPPMGGMGRSWSFALFMHLLLLAALTWGVHWKSQPDTISASAELWSALPIEAAPAANEPEPSPPEPVKAPEPAPATPPKVNATAEREAADIALKKDKEKKKLEEKKLAELEKKKKLEKEKLEKEKIEKEKAKEKEKEKANEIEKKKKEEAKKIAKEEKIAAERHDENVKRMMRSLSGATGNENSKGSALKSFSPSAGYRARIKKAVKDNIVFSEQISSNPETRVLVITNSEGVILSRKITQSSGNKSWDDAVIRAIDKTARLPKDVNGRLPEDGFDIGFSPNDI